MKDLQTLRAELDCVDSELVTLFEQRMKLCREVAAYKISKGLPVLDSSREEQVLDTRAAQAHDEALRPAVRELYKCLMALSRAEQQKLLEEAGCSC